MSETKEQPPTIKCPGCGREVAWLSNCGRYACIEEHGFPIMLDPVHRRAIAEAEQSHSDKAEATE